MDPLVLIIYTLIVCFFLAEGLILRLILRKEQRTHSVTQSFWVRSVSTRGRSGRSPSLGPQR
jgi:hypothetical protein